MTDLIDPIDAFSRLLYPSRDADLAKVKEVMALFTPMEAAKGELLLSSGSLWNKVFYVEEGILRLYYLTEDGREFNKGFFSEGQLVWPVAPTARSHPSLFSIAALERCRLRTAGFESFQRRLQSAGLWEGMALRFAEGLADSKFLREYEFLVKDAEARFEAAVADLSPIVDRIPDYHLASYLGITNVTLSRIRQRRRAVNLG